MMSDAWDEIATNAAWMELRAQAAACEDRDHAAEVAAWLQYWLARAQHDIDPAIAAFVAACAERERVALADTTEPFEGATGP